MNPIPFRGLWANPKKLIALALASAAILWLGWDDGDAKWLGHSTEGPVVTVRDLAGWLKQGKTQQLREIAFSNPPESLYEIGDFLVGNASPQAMAVLRELCTVPEGALVIAELAEDLPIPEALPLCRDLTRNADARVRNGAISTLFWLAARQNSFSGPWPVGMEAPSAGMIVSDRARWKNEQATGSRESFEEWRYKEAVTGFLCGDNAATTPGPAGQAAQLSQLNTELGKRFGFKLVE